MLFVYHLSMLKFGLCGSFKKVKQKYGKDKLMKNVWKWMINMAFTVFLEDFSKNNIYLVGKQQRKRFGNLWFADKMQQWIG